MTKKEETTDLVSVDDAKPIEGGGPAARTGFNYQDEIAVSFLIQMLEDPFIIKVHCETHDDILLVSGSAGSKERIAEFVQVKASEQYKLWSVADLCQPDNGKAGSSIFEKSFAQDRCIETSRFRLVTLRPVVKALQVITCPLGAVGRTNAAEDLQQLKDELATRFPELLSSKENGTAYWVDNCVWQECHSEQAVRDSNLVRLLTLSASEDRLLLQELAEILLDELRGIAKSAGDAKWVPHSDKKIITRIALREWWGRRTQEVVDGASAPSGGKLRSKMLEVGLPSDLVALAIGLRRDYSMVSRTPQYMKTDQADRLQRQVKSEVMSLRAKYVADQANLDGAEFHALCVKRMDEMNSQRADGIDDYSAYLKGCMYDITDRCLLRFTRPGQ